MVCYPASVVLYFGAWAPGSGSSPRRTFPGRLFSLPLLFSVLPVRSWSAARVHFGFRRPRIRASFSWDGAGSSFPLPSSPLFFFLFRYQGIVLLPPSALPRYRSDRLRGSPRTYYLFFRCLQAIYTLGGCGRLAVRSRSRRRGARSRLSPPLPAPFSRLRRHVRGGRRTTYQSPTYLPPLSRYFFTLNALPRLRCRFRFRCVSHTQKWRN